jgi:hypothetical protein
MAADGSMPWIARVRKEEAARRLCWWSRVCEEAGWLGVGGRPAAGGRRPDSRPPRGTGRLVVAAGGGQGRTLVAALPPLASVGGRPNEG